MKRFATTLVLLGALALVFAFLPAAASAVDGAISKERPTLTVVHLVSLSTTDAAPPDGGGKGDPDNTGEGLNVSDSEDGVDGSDDLEGTDEMTWEEYLLCLVIEFLPVP